jgi:hypothetical protein
MAYYERPRERLTPTQPPRSLPLARVARALRRRVSLSIVEVAVAVTIGDVVARLLVQ